MSQLAARRNGRMFHRARCQRSGFVFPFPLRWTCTSIGTGVFVMQYWYTEQTGTPTCITLSNERSLHASGSSPDSSPGADTCRGRCRERTPAGAGLDPAPHAHRFGGFSHWRGKRGGGLLYVQAVRNPSSTRNRAAAVGYNWPLSPHQESDVSGFAAFPDQRLLLHPIAVFSGSPGCIFPGDQFLADSVRREVAG